MPKREPDQVWKAVVKEAAEDEREFQRAAGATPEQVDASLRDKGLDPAAVRAGAGDWRREIEQRVALRKAQASEAQSRTRSVRPQRRPSPMFLLIAAVVGAALGGGVVYAMTHPAPPPLAPAPPAPTPTPPAPVDSALPELVAADTFRRDALAACDQKQWADCLAGLDRAREMDPAGDATKVVTDAREKAIRAVWKDKPDKPEIPR